jgi:hypothetical protein
MNLEGVIVTTGAPGHCEPRSEVAIHASDPQTLAYVTSFAITNAEDEILPHETLVTNC